tara:strand:+ start:1098 stop:1970 length:873 start_codon:yes stop_codon:yes gene_type:complete
MIKEKIYSENNLFIKGNLKFAVIGHIEWMNFLNVDLLPRPGRISHSQESLEYPAGGGALIAKTLYELNNGEVHFFTSLGNDFYGEKSAQFFIDLGLKLHVAWRNKPTRRGFSLIDKDKERSITIIGERLSPKYNDNLDWDILKDMDGIFITAGDVNLFKKARESKVVCTTPRAGIKTINDSGIILDGLIGSNLDPDEKFLLSDLFYKPRYIIKTEGENGCISIPGGKFNAIKSKNIVEDSYGCGDSFAAGILFGLSSNWSLSKTINLGTLLGRNCVEHFGPYPNISKIIT